MMNLEENKLKIIISKSLYRDKLPKACVALTISLFGKTKGFFCFHFEKRTAKKPVGNREILHKLKEIKISKKKNQRKPKGLYEVCMQNSATRPFEKKEKKTPKIHFQWKILWAAVY